VAETKHHSILGCISNVVQKQFLDDTTLMLSWLPFEVIEFLSIWMIQSATEEEHLFFVFCARDMRITDEIRLAGCLARRGASILYNIIMKAC